MASSISIREATAEDAEALGPLLATLGYPADPVTIRRRLHDLALLDPTGETLVADDGERLLGFATLHCTPTLHRPTAVGRITGLAVLPDAQGRGVGRLLVAEAERRFQARALERVEVTSGPTHSAAYPFYRARGYADQGIRFSKPLTP